MIAALEVTGTGLLRYFDTLLFAVLPYVAFGLFFVVTIRRYRQQSFTYSSLSSQFLENQRHFWGLVPFHYGVLIVLLGHAVGLLVPRGVLLWNGSPLRLYILEISGLACGLLALVGLVSAIVRRLGNGKLRHVTTPVDWVLHALLLLQLSSGVSIAVLYNWGSSWYAAAAAPYLWSLALLKPEIAYVTAMPFLVKLHVVGAFALIGFFPFTRLVHVLVIPNPYLWRRPQVVRWYWPRRKRSVVVTGTYTGRRRSWR